MNNILKIVTVSLFVAIGSSYGSDATGSGIDVSPRHESLRKDKAAKPRYSSASPIVNSPAMLDRRDTLIADARVIHTDKQPHGHPHTGKPRSKYDLRDLRNPGKPGVHTHDRKDGAHHHPRDVHTHDHEDGDAHDHAATHGEEGHQGHGHDRDHGDDDHDAEGGYDRVWDVVTMG